MSTSAPFQELIEEDVTKALCEVLVPRLSEHIASRAFGHCMRVANLNLALMRVLCQTLRKTCPNAQIYILSETPGENGTASETNKENVFISSTKLVELRNPLPDGSQRPPLLVFLPINLHASAEDSFGVATFEDISVTDAYRELQVLLIERVPAPLRGYIHTLFSILDLPRWTWSEHLSTNWDWPQTSSCLRSPTDAQPHSTQPGGHAYTDLF
jgi:DNA phosphorothioation-dependent restriction protein DptH